MQYPQCYFGGGNTLRLIYTPEIATPSARNDKEGGHCAAPPFCSATLQGRAHEAKASHYTRQNILVLMLVLKYQDQIAKVKKQNDKLNCTNLPHFDL